MLKRKKCIDDINEDDKKLSNKIIDLCLSYQIEDSHYILKLIDLQIKNCQNQIEMLEDNKPLWFRKKKLKEHNKKIEKIENQIIKYYKDMDDEVDLIIKMKNSIES